MKCLFCQKIIEGRKNKKWCSEKCRYNYRIKNNKLYQETHKKYLYELYFKRQQFLSNYKLKKGCQVCGYNKCASALVFHHLNPNNKEFRISRVNNYTIKNLKKEIKKCIILCANCHAELHAGLLKKVVKNNKS